MTRLQLFEQQWNGCWGLVTQTSRGGLIRVSLGRETLQLYSGDLFPISPLSDSLLSIAQRVLRLRQCSLDEIETQLLNFFQGRLEFTPRQVHYLEHLESLLLPE